MRFKKSAPVVALGLVFVFATQDPNHIAILPHVPELPIPTDITSLQHGIYAGATGGTAIPSTSTYALRYLSDDGS